MVTLRQVKGETLGAIAPLQYYALVAVSNVVATTCQYEALKHVSLPVQTLGKTAKMLPVMVRSFYPSTLLHCSCTPIKSDLSWCDLSSTDLGLSDTGKEVLRPTV